MKRAKKPTQTAEEQKRDKEFRRDCHQRAVEEFRSSKPKKGKGPATWQMFEALSHLASDFGTKNAEGATDLYRAILLVGLAHQVDNYPDQTYTELLRSKFDEVERAIAKGGPR